MISNGWQSHIALPISFSIDLIVALCPIELELGLFLQRWQEERCIGEEGEETKGERIIMVFSVVVVCFVCLFVLCARLFVAYFASVSQQWGWRKESNRIVVVCVCLWCGGGVKGNGSKLLTGSIKCCWVRYDLGNRDEGRENESPVVWSGTKTDRWDTKWEKEKDEKRERKMRCVALTLDSRLSSSLVEGQRGIEGHRGMGYVWFVAFGRYLAKEQYSFRQQSTSVDNE